MTTVEVVTLRACCIGGRRVEADVLQPLSQTTAWLMVCSGKARLHNPDDQALIDGAPMAETLASLGTAGAEATG